MCAAVTEPQSSQVQAKPKSKNGGFLCCPAIGCCIGSKANKTNNTKENGQAENTPISNGPSSQPNNNSKNPFLGQDGEADENTDEVAATVTSASFPSRQNAYSPGSPSTSSCPPMSPPSRPTRQGFLVSFLVDARGGAMTGSRGSGLRLIIPQGAVQHPTRVTCRYLRGSGDRLPFPPPLMEREALSSRVIEVGPSGVQFGAPVLLEVPHFASLRGGERELIVLRCDDGETWREHTAVYLQTGWQGGDEEIYADFVASTGITAAYEELDTSRVVRISATSFPKYFAILSRIREEIRAIGADGGKVIASHAPHVQGYFPAGALQKKIKVALQVQTVPNAVLNLTCPNVGLKFSPLVAIEPRRRRFHVAVQVALPLSSAKDPSRVHLLCSLTGGTSPKAHWEDVTESTQLVVSKGSVVFETKVSALFWAVYAEAASVEAEAAILPAAQHLYDELLLSPYMARIVVLYKPHSPHAWCDTLRVLCVTDDKAEAWGEPGTGWITVSSTEEMEVATTSTLALELEGGIEVASDCQLEFGHRSRLVFKPFQSNFATLLIRQKKGSEKRGRLTVKRAFGHLESQQQVALASIELDLRDGKEEEEVVDVVKGDPRLMTSMVAHVVHWNDDDYEEVVPNAMMNDHVIRVKEYSPQKDDDVVFVSMKQ